MNEIEELKETIRSVEVSESRKTGATEQIARIAVEGYYDFQKVRQAMMNRVRDIVRKKREGIPFDVVEEEKEEKDYSKEYNDSNLPDLVEAMFEGEDEKFEEQDVHEEFTEQEYSYLRDLLDIAHESEKTEKNFEIPMEYFKEEPIYKRFLRHVRGINTVMNANLIKRIGYCEESGPHVSNLWSYAGLAPGQERTRGEKAGYNVTLKTLCWKISRQMVMAGSLYKKYFYDPYKREQERKRGYSDARHEGAEKEKKVPEDPPAEWHKGYAEGWNMAVKGVNWDYDGSAPSSKGHADERAKRYMVKKFLKHYWVIARDMKGLETTEPWIVKHGDHDKREDSPEDPYWMLHKLMDEG